MEINKLSLESLYEPKSIHNLKPILYVGVQFESYSWMCVCGWEIYCTGFLRVCWREWLRKRSGSKGESAEENRRKVNSFRHPKWYLFWEKGQYILEDHLNNTVRSKQKQPGDKEVCLCSTAFFVENKPISSFHHNFVCVNYLKYVTTTIKKE